MATGRKTGGRGPGSRNKATAARAKEIARSGLTPLDYMLSVLRNPESDEVKMMWAAEKAAPYCHPKLSSVEAKIDGKLTLEALVMASVNERGGK